MASDEREFSPSSKAGTPSSSKLPHSYSSPAGVDAATMDDDAVDVKQKAGRLLSINVVMLDESTVTFHVPHKSLGQGVFDLSCKQLNLLETDYFGLEYEDSNHIKYWLDCQKPLNRQLGLSLARCTLHFGVKFYTPDPAQLEEEFTRYLYCLQIKRDLANNFLQCNDNTAALMASYIVQADCGDYSPDDYPDHSYLSSCKFVPNQDDEMERKIMENHKKHVGQSPAQADLNLLETARRCELYGLRMHAAKDHEGVPLNLAVAHMGVLVFQNLTKINTFSWAKVRKLSFKRKRFLIKLHPEGYGYYKDTVEFFFESRNECKNFWKKCVEHHGFFRCSAVKKAQRQKTRVLSRGSSFRYSGRTQKEVIEFVRENFIKREPFQRSQSFRHSSSVHSGIGWGGTSKSVQPLVASRELEVATPTSHSCGSMILNDLDTSAGVSGPSSPVASNAANNSVGETRSLTIATVEMTEAEAREDVGYANAVVDDRVVGGTSEQIEKQDIDVSHSPDVEDDDEEEESVPVVSTPTTTTVDVSLDISRQPSQDTTTFSDIPLDSSVRTPTSEFQSVTVTKNNNFAAEVDQRRKVAVRYPTDKAYYISKEILATERTYKKDLEIILGFIQWVKEAMKNDISLPDAVHSLQEMIEPVHEFHCSFLNDIEHRLATWEGFSNAHLKGDYQKIGDVLWNNLSCLTPYNDYLDQYLLVLEQLDLAFRINRRFEYNYREYEMQKICYLPVNNLLLKPIHRLLQYKLLLERLIRHYGSDHPDAGDCRISLQTVRGYWAKMIDDAKKGENFVKLSELQRDIIGIDDVIRPTREFIREGCLQKLSKKGFQQRMFFLFSDVLMYANRTATSTLQFKIHGQVPVKHLSVEDCESRFGVNNCFSIFGVDKSMIVSASCSDEKEKWMEDLRRVSAAASYEWKTEKSMSIKSKSFSSSEELLEDNDGMIENEEHLQSPSRPMEKPAQQRSNTAVHVCWHRNTSVGNRDHIKAVENQLSGYLLRKFKNSSGWQKLWVVFTNFCLFFYKKFQDESPLASLPLLGYTVSTPSEADNINKEYVFKLQFKNHVYFFRAESEYSYGRWMEVVCSATQHSARIRLFSRTESVADVY
ncbi:hypothetical protein CHUAL_001305 [Chamberlinius hualienensis]